MNPFLALRHAIWVALLVSASTTAGATLWPHDVAPSAFWYDTLSGRGCVAKGRPWVLTTLRRSDAVSEHMLRDAESLKVWPASCDSAPAVCHAPTGQHVADSKIERPQAACRDTPPNTVLAFASWSRAASQAAQDMRDLQAAFQRACAGLNTSRYAPCRVPPAPSCPSSTAALRPPREVRPRVQAQRPLHRRQGPALHFMAQPVQQQPAWLFDTLEAWTHKRTVVTVTGEEGRHRSQRSRPAPTRVTAHHSNMAPPCPPLYALCRRARAQSDAAPPGFPV